MLLQSPQNDTAASFVDDPPAGGAFVEALRRDLAGAPLIAYGAVVGGWRKRAFDLVLVAITAPVWLAILGLVIGWAKLRGRAPVLTAHECVGYGGKIVRFHELRLGARVEPLHRGQPAIGAARPRLLERLPFLFNVLGGKMSLVGPSPLSHAELATLKGAQRYYMSARPGVVDVFPMLGGESNLRGRYKIYARSWSMLADLLIVCDAFGRDSESETGPAA